MKHLIRASLALATAGVVSLAGAQAPSREATYPVKPIRMIVPFPPGSTPEQLGTLIQNDRVKWQKVIKDAGIKAE